MMMEFVHFVAQDSRHFAGTIIFILAVCWGLSWIVGAARGEPGDLP